MPIKTFHAKNYLTRVDLDRAILAELGQDIKANKDAGHIISGTKDELKKLNLSDNCFVYGCKVVSIDITTESELKDKLQKRGKVWQA